MKFPYGTFPLKTRSAHFGLSLLRPIVPVTIQNKPREIRYAALIDSGADFNIFHAEIAASVGLDVQTGEETHFSGIHAASAAKGFWHTVTMVVGGHAFETRIVFSWDVVEQGYGVLGQQGFFNHFKVVFDYQKTEIELKEKRIIDPALSRSGGKYGASNRPKG